MITNRMSTFFLLTIIGLISISSADPERNLTSWINYNCTLKECTQNVDSQTDWNLVYTLSKPTDQASNSDQGNNVHFIWSTKGGLPGFLATEATNNARLTFNWSSLIDDKPKSIEFNSSQGQINPNYIGLLVKELFVWNDTNKNGVIDSGEPVEYVPMTKLVWSNVSEIQFDKNIAYASYKLKANQSQTLLNGDFQINVQSDSETRHFERLPRLFYSPKSSHIEIVLNNVTFNLPWNATRIGMTFAFVTGSANEPISQGFDSINDEYSPGIFREEAYSFVNNEKANSFVLFKPNAYNSEGRHMQEAVEIKQSPFVKAKEKTILELNNAFEGFFVGSNLESHLNVWETTITFGDSNDQLYSETNYTVFSMVIGLDDIPKASLSLFIQIIIIIGSGLTLLVLLIFPVSICLMARNMRVRREMALLNQENVQ